MAPAARSPGRSRSSPPRRRHAPCPPAAQTIEGGHTVMFGPYLPQHAADLGLRL